MLALHSGAAKIEVPGVMTRASEVREGLGEGEGGVSPLHKRSG
jgi:hypothetical protein